MNIHEYQAKEVFARHGVPTVRGGLATTPEKAREIARHIGGTVVVKAQVLVGGRGKGGGIRLAATPDEAASAAQQILGTSIKGNSVSHVFVAEAIDVTAELYLGVTIDRSSRCLTVIASSRGGIDIEEVARSTPDSIVRIPIDPLLGLLDYQAREVAFDLGLDARLTRVLVPIVRALHNAFVASDASLAEINPLAITGDGTLLALDTKMVIDDNALNRQPELAGWRDLELEDPFERRAREQGLSYVRLNGRIGCIVNGAGLAMATMDIITLHGESPANFLDLGGGARADRVAAALRLILAAPGVEGVLFNIFGGMTRCDEVARGIIDAMREVEIAVPMVVRLVGTNEADGRDLLLQHGVVVASSMDEAAGTIIALVKERREAGGLS